MKVNIILESKNYNFLYFNNLKYFNFFYYYSNSFTPIESTNIPACRQTGMLRMVEFESISSLFLPAGRQGGRGQRLPLLTGVYFIS